MVHEADAAKRGTLDNNTFHLGLGLGPGGYAMATTVLAGFACPVCIVAAPALVAAGVYQKVKARKHQPGNDGAMPPGACCLHRDGQARFRAWQRGEINHASSNE